MLVELHMKQPIGVHANEIREGDMWDQVWEKMQNANHQATYFGGTWKDWPIESSIWLEERKGSLSYARQQRTETLLGLVDEGSRVLDIGAGTGRISADLADRVGWVTAVEPAGGMISLFRKNTAGIKKGNLDLIPKKWEDVEVNQDLTPYYDLTIASYSLGMADLEESIRKIQAVTRGKAVIYWYGKDRDTEKEARALWPLLHQWPYCPVPKSNVVINLLYELGIKPEYKIFTYTESTRYKTVEDALVEYAIRYNAVNQRQIHLLRSYIERELEIVAGGYVKSHSHADMQITWQV